MQDSIIYSGSFIGTGNAITIPFRGDLSFIRVINLTEAAAQNAGHGFEYFWNRNMAAGGGIAYYHAAGDHFVSVNALAANTGFTFFDLNAINTAPVFGAPVVAGIINNNAQATVNTANTAGLLAGDIVKLENCAGVESLNGFEFEITNIVAGVSFQFAYPMANAPGGAGLGGTYSKMTIPAFYQPQRFYILNITQAANAVITTSVSHGLNVGQAVRINVPDARFGMPQINGLLGTVIAITAGTVTVNIDSTAFTAFAFALPATVPFTMPTLVPVGENTGVALLAGANILDDALYNQAILYLRLEGGILSPAGSNNDVILYFGGRSGDR